MTHEEKAKKRMRDAITRDPANSDKYTERYLKEIEYEIVTDSLDFSPAKLNVFTKKPKPREYVVETLIGKHQLAYLVAAGGTGKGFIELDLAVHVALGKPWLGLPVTQGLVVLLCLEDSKEEVDRRMHDIVRRYLAHNKIEDKAERFAVYRKVLENVRWVSLEGQRYHLIAEDDRQLVNTQEVDPLAQKLKALRPILVIMDPLGQLHALSENDNTVGSFMTGALGYIRKIAKTAVLVAAHVSKEGDNKSKARGNSGDELTRESANIMRGAASFATGARSVFVVVVYEPKAAGKLFGVEAVEAVDRFSKLMHVKCNYGRKTRDVRLERGAKGIWGQSTVLPRDRTNDLRAWQEYIRDYLKAHGKTCFSKTDITQNDERRQAIFGDKISRRDSEYYLDEAKGLGGVEKLTRQERAQLSAAERKGGGARYRICMELSQ